jgi:hypothetical protein
MPAIHMHEDVVLWRCLSCGAVTPEHLTVRFEDVKKGQAINPQCCGREMRACSSRKGAAQIDVIERSRGTLADGTAKEFHPHRPWWTKEWEVGYLATPERGGSSEVFGWVGIGLNGTWEFLTITGQEGKGPDKITCVQTIVAVVTGSVESGKMS